MVLVIATKDNDNISVVTPCC